MNQPSQQHPPLSPNSAPYPPHKQHTQNQPTNRTQNMAQASPLPGKDPNLEPETPPKTSPSSPPPPRSTDLAREVENLAAKVNLSAVRNSMLHKDHSLALQQIQQLATEMAELRADFTTCHKEHSQLREDYAKLQKDHKSLKTSHASLQTSQSRAQQTLAELRLYLDTFQADHSKLLSEQGSLGEGLQRLTRDLSSLQSQLQPHLTRVQELCTQQSDLQQDTASLKEDVTSQSGLLQTLQSGLGQLWNDRDARRGEIANLEASLETLRSQVATLETDQNQLLLLIQDLDAEARSLHREQKQAQAEVDTTGVETVDPNPKTFTQEVTHTHPDLREEIHNLRKIVDKMNSKIGQMDTEMKEKLHPDPANHMSSGPGGPDTESGSHTPNCFLRAPFGEEDSPLFKASILSKRRTKQDQAMIFDVVELNQGGYYNSDTGTFTAPHASHYCFSLRAGVRDHLSDTGHACLMVGDSQRFKFQLFLANRPRWEQVCVDLAAGDTVWVKTLCPLGHYDSSHNFYFTGAETLRCPTPPLPPPPPVFE